MDIPAEVVVNFDTAPFVIDLDSFDTTTMGGLLATFNDEAFLRQLAARADHDFSTASKELMISMLETIRHPPNAYILAAFALATLAQERYGRR